MSDEGELPAGWKRVRLSEVASAVLGKMLDRTKHTKGKLLPYLRNQNVRWGTVDTSDLSEMYFEDGDEARYGLKPGDVLICEGGEPGRAAVWDGRIPNLRFQKAIHRVRPSAQLLPEWLVLRLRADAHAGRLGEYFTGTTIRHLTGAALSRFELPLPPAAEQRRIVARHSALSARSERARGALDAIPPLLEKLRQSILAAAFRGDLTKDWRAQNPDVEPASELLKRIRVERRKKWEEAELAKMAARGKVPAGEAWKAKYKEPEPVDAAGLPELPEGWCWATIGEIALAGGGLTKNASKRAGGTEVPLVSVAAVQLRRIDVSALSRIEVGAEDAGKGDLADGDLLVVEGNGSLSHIGRVALWSDEVTGARHQNHLIRVRPALARSEYLLEWLASPGGRAAIVAAATSATGLYTLSLSKVEALPIPLAPLPEQAGMLRRVASAVGAVATRAADTADLSDRLRHLDQAILARAFRGELSATASPSASDAVALR